MEKMEKISRRQYLAEKVLLEEAEAGRPTNFFMVIESIESTALANNWNLEETKTREEWNEQAG